MIVTCCGVELVDGYTLLAHLKSSHTSKSKKNAFVDAQGRETSFACILPNCSGPSKGYKAFSYLRAHLFNKHPEFMNTNELNFSSNYEQLTNQASGIDFNSVDFQEPLPSCADDFEMEIEVQADRVPQMQPGNGDHADELTRSQEYSILLQKLRLEAKTSQKTVNTISSSVLDYARSQLRSLEPPASADRPADDSILEELIRISNSTFRQLKNCDTVLSNKDYLRRIKVNGGEFVHVDLRLHLIHMLKQDHIREEIFHDKLRPPNESCFRTYKEARFYEEPAEKEIRIQLVPYYDDMDVKSGGSSGALTKMSCSYFTVLNLKYAHQCKRNDLLFNAIASKSDMDKVGKHEFFRPFVQSLNEINSNPIQLTDGFYVTVNLAMCAVDLLASHFLQDISTSFRWNSCQYCEVGDNATLARFHQTRNNHAQPKPLSSTHVFKDVANLKGRIFGPDNFHVLNEGVEEWISTFILSRLTARHRSKVDADCNGKFKPLFVHGVPYGMKNGDLNGTGVQKYDFFIMLSILIEDEMLDKESSEWKLYLQARKIVDFCESEFYERQDLVVFEQEVEDFVHNYAMVTGTMKPKVHLLQHYPEMIREFSVLRELETKRQERTNRLLKLFTRDTSNWSYAIQMAKAWTLNFLLNAFKPDRSEVVFECYSSFELGANLTETQLRFVDRSKDLIVLKRFQLDNDIVIERGATFLLNYTSTNQLPTFVKIRYIFKQENRLKIVSSPVRCERFIKRIYCFKVNTGDELMELDLNQLPHYRKLIHIRISGSELIKKTFYVPFRFSSLYD